MDSASHPTPPAPPAPPAEPSASADDLTARARLRDAAIDLIGRSGAARTSLRAVAEAAGVSTPLVVHHYGSKAGLITACDQHVVAVIREGKRAAVAEGAGMDALAAVRGSATSSALLRYLATRLADSSPLVDELVDELVADAETMLTAGAASGMLQPTDDVRGRAAVLTIWSLGALVLHAHLARLLDADPTTDAAGIVAYSRPATEILGRGVLDPALADRVLAAYDQVRTEVAAPPADPDPTPGAPA